MMLSTRTDQKSQFWKIPIAYAVKIGQASWSILQATTLHDKILTPIWDLANSYAPATIR